MTTPRQSCPTPQGEALKPCPFCGSEAHIPDYCEDRFYVCCTSVDCYCSVGESYDRDAMPEHIFRTKEDAVAAWNRRPTPATAAGQEAVMWRWRTKGKGKWSMWYEARSADDLADNINNALQFPGLEVESQTLYLHPSTEAEDRAEQFIQSSIDNAPEPLRRLGEYLTKILNEDEWATVEPMLLGAAAPVCLHCGGKKVIPDVNGELLECYWCKT